MDSDDDFLYEDTDSGNEEGDESDEQVGHLNAIQFRIQKQRFVFGLMFTGWI